MRALLLILFACVAHAATPFEDAVAAYRRSDYTAALKILDKQIPIEPDKLELYLLRGDIHSAQGQHEKAIADYTRVLEQRPNTIGALYRRGMAHFRAAKIKESIADFDKFAEIQPDRAPHLWQRGISYYYAGEFEKGRKQFESHQTVNSHDVENAVWHFMCIAKLDGIDKARAQLIPITDDGRVPMAQIQSLFAGKAEPRAVLDAANAGHPPEDVLNDRLFYAHLYLGLYEEARGNAQASLDHMKLATTKYAQDHYMGDVARVHLALRNKKDK